MGGKRSSNMSNSKSDRDLEHLVEILADDIAGEYGLDPKFFRGSVEDVLVALASRGIDPAVIRQELEARARSMKSGIQKS